VLTLAEVCAVLAFRGGSAVNDDRGEIRVLAPRRLVGYDLPSPEGGADYALGVTVR
jgi:hypothetical protein